MKVKMTAWFCALSLMMGAFAYGETILPSDDWLNVWDDGDVELDVGATLDEDLENYFDVDSGSAATITISGLPTGLRYNSKTQRLTGKTTRKGVYYVNCSAKNKNGYQMSAMTRWIVGDATDGDYDNIGLYDNEYFAEALDSLDDLSVGEPCYAWISDGETGVVAVSGLPTGLRLVDCGKIPGLTCGDSKEIDGTPTKAGKFKITFTDSKRRKTVKTVIVRDAEPRYQMVTVGTDSQGRGTVSGSGVKKPGSKMSISAKAARGYYFAGWYANEECTTHVHVDESSYRIANHSFVLSSSIPETLYAKFVSKDEDSDISFSGEDEWIVNTESSYDTYLADVQSITLPTASAKGLPAGVKFTTFSYEDVFETRLVIPDTSKLKPGTSLVTLTAKNLSGATVTKNVRVVVPNLKSSVFDGLDYESDAYSYVVGDNGACRPDFDFSVEEGWTVTASGMPPGVKFYFDKTTGEARLSSGGATKAGIYTVTLTAKKGRQIEKATITITVNPFPAAAVGTYSGVIGYDLPPTEGLDDYETETDLYGVEGTFSLTVAANGRCSVKFVSEGKTYSLSGYPCAVLDDEINIYLSDTRLNKCDLYLSLASDGESMKLSGTVGTCCAEFEVSASSSKALSTSRVQNALGKLVKMGRIRAIPENGWLVCPACVVPGYATPTLFFTVNKNGTIRSSGKIAGRSVSGSTVLRVDSSQDEVVLFADFYDYSTRQLTNSYDYSTRIGRLVYRVILQPETYPWADSVVTEGYYIQDAIAIGD